VHSSKSDNKSAPVSAEDASEITFTPLADSNANFSADMRRVSKDERDLLGSIASIEK